MKGASAALVDANKRRAAYGAAFQCMEARQAIRIIEQATPRSPGKRRSTPRGKVLHDQYLFVLRLRLTHSDKTLAEIAALNHTTKDTYTGQLRRALTYAVQLQRIYE